MYLDSSLCWWVHSLPLQIDSSHPSPWDTRSVVDKVHVAAGSQEWAGVVVKRPTGSIARANQRETPVYVVCSESLYLYNTHELFCSSSRIMHIIHKRVWSDSYMWEGLSRFMHLFWLAYSWRPVVIEDTSRAPIVAIFFYIDVELDTKGLRPCGDWWWLEVLRAPPDQLLSFQQLISQRITLGWISTSGCSGLRCKLKHNNKEQWNCCM